MKEMWELQTTELEHRTLRGRWASRGEMLSYREVINLWKDNAEFRQAFANGIAGAAYEAVFWETPPVTEANLDRPYEQVLVEANALQRVRPDPVPFGSQFAADPEKLVISFPNLGGDAVLVVPTPQSDLGCYPQLIAFLRKAPPDQIDAFWKRAGEAMSEQVSDTPVWLSTAGLGVSWLHLRLDSRPKYYRHTPYKVFG